MKFYDCNGLESEFMFHVVIVYEYFNKEIHA